MSPATPTKKVSVVVPVYNTEAFLAQCLDSLVSQTLDDIEIIVVNDGSPDASQSIIDDYAARYSDKVVAVSQPNGGLGSARNLGVEHATGRYIGFVDSDDFVEIDMYRHLYDEAERTESDVAICRYRHYSLDESYSVVGGNFPFSEGDVFPAEGFFLNSRVMIVVNKLYRAELVRRVPFQNTWFEDVAWSPVVMSYAERICYTPSIYYHYIMHDGTITTSHDDARTLQEITSLRWALANANPQRTDQVAYMAARRLLFDAQVRPAYADKFTQAIHELREVIGRSHHVLDDPELYLDVRRFLEHGFSTIPKTILFSGTRRPDASGDFWKDRFAFPVDATYVDVDSLRPAEGDEFAIQLVDRPDALRDYLTLAYIARNGGLAIDDHLATVQPIAWALGASRSFFAFESPERISSRIFGAQAGAAVVRDLIALFRDHLNDADPFASALGAYFLRSGRVAWSYPEFDGDFAAPYIELEGSCRVYASSVFINDFGLGIATTSLYPRPVAGPDGTITHFETTPEYQAIARRISMDYARWSCGQKKPQRPAAARKTIPGAPRPEPATATDRVSGPIRRLKASARRAKAVLGRGARLSRQVHGSGSANAAAIPGTDSTLSPRPLVIRGRAACVLLYVGGFTTASSAQRAHLIAAWLRDAYGADTEVSVLVTDRGNAAQRQRAEAVRSGGIRLITRAKPGPADPDLMRQAWERAIGAAQFDLVIVATPRGGLAEASILGAAPTGTRVLCRIGQEWPQPLEGAFDVALDRLSELHSWIDRHRTRTH